MFRLGVRILSLLIVSLLIVQTLPPAHVSAQFFPANSTGYKKIAHGSDFTIALDQSGNVWTWGYSNYYGQQGNGTQFSSRYPVKIHTGPNKITDIAAGDYHVLALDESGDVYAWGSNDQAQVRIHTGSDNDRQPILSPVLTLSGVQSIAAGSMFSIALKNDGSVETWGYYYEYYLHNEQQEDSSSHYLKVIDVDGDDLSGIETISAGQYTGYALDGDGQLYAWGDNRYYQFGNDDYENSKAVKVNDRSEYRVNHFFANSHSMTAFAVCESENNDILLCGWGDNRRGQLGVISDNSQSTFISLDYFDDKQVLDLSGTNEYTSAIITGMGYVEPTLVAVGDLSALGIARSDRLSGYYEWGEFAFNNDTFPSLSKPLSIHAHSNGLTVLNKENNQDRLITLSDGNREYEPELIDHDYRTIKIQVIDALTLDPVTNERINIAIMNLEQEPLMDQFTYDIDRTDMIEIPFIDDPGDIIITYDFYEWNDYHRLSSLTILPPETNEYIIKVQPIDDAIWDVEFRDQDLKEGRISGEINWWLASDGEYKVYFLDAYNNKIGTAISSASTNEDESYPTSATIHDGTLIPNLAESLGIFSVNGEVETLQGVCELFDMYKSIYYNQIQYDTEHSYTVSRLWEWSGPSSSSQIAYYVAFDNYEGYNFYYLAKHSSEVHRFSFDNDDWGRWKYVQLYAVTSDGRISPPLDSTWKMNDVSGEDEDDLPTPSIEELNEFNLTANLINLRMTGDNRVSGVVTTNYDHMNNHDDTMYLFFADKYKEMIRPLGFTNHPVYGMHNVSIPEDARYIGLFIKGWVLDDENDEATFTTTFFLPVPITNLKQLIRDNYNLGSNPINIAVIAKLISNRPSWFPTDLNDDGVFDQDDVKLMLNLIEWQSIPSHDR